MFVTSFVLTDIFSSSIFHSNSHSPHTLTSPNTTFHHHSTYLLTLSTISQSPNPAIAVFTKKKYKPVTSKVRPIAAELPECFCNIKGDPLADLAVLNPHPPLFIPTSHYTQEHHDIFDKAHPPGFLWPTEHDLIHHLMMLHQDSFA